MGETKVGFCKRTITVEEKGYHVIGLLSGEPRYLMVIHEEGDCPSLWQVLWRRLTSGRSHSQSEVLNRNSGGYGRPNLI